MNKEENKLKTLKNPWPTKDAMEQVYEKKLWGGNESDFYSGTGSHLSDYVIPYIEALTKFFKSFENPLVVCDLGCGDFNVGKELVEYTQKNIAVDIVADLIRRNKELFQDEKLEFYCLDIASDELPSGDCAIVRQVLQHLSNDEVHKLLTKLKDFKYVILTEHVPEGEFIANKDIISGQGTRLKKQSGIDLLASPFNLKVKEEKRMLSIPSQDSEGVIVTTLYRM